MFSPHTFVLWLSVMSPLIFSPGPANLSVAGAAAQGGIRQTLPFIAGVSLVNLILLFSIGFAFSSLHQGAPFIFKIIELIGALYICYLSSCFLKTPSSTDKQHSSEIILNFRSGITIQLLNGKFYPSTIMMFSLFLDESQAMPQQIIIISLMLTLLALSSYGFWAMLGHTIHHNLDNKKAIFIQRFVFGGMLLLTGLWFLIENFYYWYALL